MELLRIAIVSAPSARRHARLIADDLDLHRTDRRQFRADLLDPRRDRDLRALATRPYDAVVLLLSHDLDLAWEAQRRIRDLRERADMVGLSVDQASPALASFADQLGIHIGRRHIPLATAAEYEMRIALGILCTSLVIGLLLKEWLTDSGNPESLLCYRKHRFAFDKDNAFLGFDPAREPPPSGSSASRLYSHLVVYGPFSFFINVHKNRKEMRTFLDGLVETQKERDESLSIALLRLYESLSVEKLSPAKLKLHDLLDRIYKGWPAVGSVRDALIFAPRDTKQYLDEMELPGELTAEAGLLLRAYASVQSEPTPASLTESSGAGLLDLDRALQATYSPKLLLNGQLKSPRFRRAPLDEVWAAWVETRRPDMIDRIRQTAIDGYRSAMLKDRGQ